MKRWQNNPYNIQPACAKHNIDHTTNTYQARKAHVERILEQEGWVDIGLWMADCPSDGFVKRDDFQEICLIIESYAKEQK